MNNKIFFLATALLLLLVSCNKITRKAAENELEKAGTSLTSEAVSKEARKSIAEDAEKLTLKNAFYVSSKISLDDAEKIIGKKLGHRGVEEWNKILSKGNADWSKALALDLKKDKSFAKEINKNPALLTVYADNIGSPRFRTNITILRYANYRSSLYRSFDYKRKN